MSMRKFKKAASEIELPGENLLYLEEIAQNVFDPSWAKEFNYQYNLGLIPYNAFTILQDVIGINGNIVWDLYHGIQYGCPFTRNFYSGAYPVSYLSYKKPNLEPLRNKDEYKFFCSQINEKREYEKNLTHIGPIGRAFMGHGYSKDVMDNGDDPLLADVITQINQEEYVVFKVWKKRDLD